MFRNDPLLFWITVVLSAVSIAPIFVTPFLPLVDLGSNVGAAGLIDEILRHHGVAWRFYSINPLPVPYWPGYLIMSALEVLAGPFVAAKATVALSVLVLPISHMRLLTALERSPRLGLWAFLVAWDVNTYWGWFTFVLAMAASLYAIAWLVEMRSLRDALKVIPLTALVALSHAHATALVAAFAFLFALSRAFSLRLVARCAVALSGFTVLIPWIVARLFSGGGGTSRAPFDMVNPPLSEKVVSLYRFSLDTFPQPDAANLTSLAFLLLLLGPAILGAMPGRSISPSAIGNALAFLLACVALYLFLPFEVRSPAEHWWTYPRYATYILLGLLALPRARLRGGQILMLAPGIALIVMLSIARIRQFSEYGVRTRPYLEIIKSMKRDSTFLPLDFAFDWSGTREWSLGQLHGYAAAATSSFDPHLFDHPSSPVLFRTTARLPVPDWRRPAATFSMEAQGRFYDYIITHPRNLDVVAELPDDQVELVRESGEWRLYRVKRH